MASASGTSVVFGEEGEGMKSVVFGEEGEGMKHVVSYAAWAVICAFVAGKIAGVYIATWSWWWLLMPLVPIIAAYAHRSF
jgi:hypothetical protein